MADDARDPDDGTAPEGSGSGDEGEGPDDPLRTDALPASAKCPFCGGTDTEQFASFGSAVSTSQYYCRSCRTVFEYMKWRRG